MFRDENFVYINTQSYGGEHDLTYPKLQKGSTEANKIKEKIAANKRSIEYTLHLLSNKELSEERKASLNESLLIHEQKIVELQAQLRSLPQQPCHKTLRRHTRRMSHDKLKSEILKILAEAEKAGTPFIHMEDVAFRLCAKESLVKDILRELNREGILSQPDHQALHDSNRDPYGYKDNHGWAGNIYYIRHK
jgi:hypothetical protein